jgi:hypothetical protein
MLAGSKPLRPTTASGEDRNGGASAIALALWWVKLRPTTASGEDRNAGLDPTVRP